MLLSTEHMYFSSGGHFSLNVDLCFHTIIFQVIADLRNINGRGTGMSWRGKARTWHELVRVKHCFPVFNQSRHSPGIVDHSSHSCGRFTVTWALFSPAVCKWTHTLYQMNTLFMGLALDKIQHYFSLSLLTHKCPPARPHYPSVKTR